MSKAGVKRAIIPLSFLIRFLSTAAIASFTLDSLPASWMYRTGIEGILGLKLKGKDGFYVDPCIPKDWSEYEIIYN
ncbi:hypothetical protein EXM35_18640, partial [Clostridium botulinum]|nr:hypothetical protein [Clostridium botulinum]